MRIKSKNLIFIGIVSLSLPFMLFSVFWFKVYIGIPIILFTIYILDRIIRKKLDNNTREYIIKPPYLIFAFLFILLILILGGHGEWQSQLPADWPTRTALYRDLIHQEWPTVFPDNSFLCYYFGYFLPPAFICKFILLFVGNSDIFHIIAMQIELLWGTYITFLAFLLIFDFIHKRTTGFKEYIDFKEILIVLLIFIFFSGLDVIGTLFFTPEGRPVLDWTDNIDVWSYKVYPCVVSNLWDAFNQGIIFYLACILIFMQEDMTILLYLAGVSFISMVFPLFGIGLLCIPLLIKRFKNIKELISLPNLLGVVAIIIILLFYMSQSGINTAVSNYKYPIRFCDDSITKLKDHIIFLILEFYIYFILLFKKNYKDKVYIVSGLTAFIFVFIEYVKGPWEIFLRCSMPMIFYMLILSAKEVIDFYHDKKVEVARILLIICLLIGFATPSFDIARGFYLTKNNGWKPVIHDEQYSYSDDRKYGFKLGMANQYKGYSYKDSIFHKTVGK